MSSGPPPSSYFSLNVPQCLLPLPHITFLKNSSISLLSSPTSSIFSLFLFFFPDTHARTHASRVNESHVHSLLRLPPLLCYSLSLSLTAVTHSHMEGIIVMTHSLTPVPGSSTERQRKHSLLTMPLDVRVFKSSKTVKGNMRLLSFFYPLPCAK